MMEPLLFGLSLCAAFIYCAYKVTGGPAGAFVVCLSYMIATRVWPVRNSVRFRSSCIGRPFRWLFGISINGTVDRSHKKALFALYPHGVLPFGSVCAFGMYGNDEFAKGLNMMAGVSPLAFLVPGLREALMAMGGVDARPSVLKEAIREHLLHSDRVAVALTPGGMREMARARYKKNDLYLHHKGFIRLARELDFDAIYPVYIENETAIVWPFHLFPLRLRDWTTTVCKYPIGTFFFPVPWKTNVTAHIGEPVTRGAFDDFFVNLLDTVKDQDATFWLSQRRKVDGLRGLRHPNAGRGD